MALILSLSRANEFDVDLKVVGVNEDTPVSPSVSLSVEAGDFKLSFPAVRSGKDRYTVKTPVLEGLLRAGDYELSVEVLIEGKHFVPVKDTLTVREDPRPGAVSVKESAKAPELGVAGRIGAVRESVAPVVQHVEPPKPRAARAPKVEAPKIAEKRRLVRGPVVRD